MAESPPRLEYFYDALEIRLMEEAQHDIEYKTSAAWQAVLSRHFPRPWQLLCEQAPDDSRRRVDMKVIELSGQGTLSPVMYVEVKRAGGSLREVERQGEDAGTRAVNGGGLTGIYIMTIWGLKFRVWYIPRDGEGLNALFGSPAMACKDEYLDMRSPDGAVELERSMYMVRGEPPLRQAPVVPSQHFGTSSINHQQTYVQPSFGIDQAPASGAGPSDTAPASEYVPVNAHMMTGELESEESSSEDDVEPPPEDKGKGKAKEKRKKRKRERREVKVKAVDLGTWHRTRFEFLDAKGQTVTTIKNDWVAKESDGRAIYQYHTKRVIYWCKRLE